MNDKLTTEFRRFATMGSVSSDPPGDVKQPQPPRSINPADPEPSGDVKNPPPKR